MNDKIVTAPITRWSAKAIPWNPAVHNGVEESPDSMRTRLEQAWPELCRKAGLQPTATPAVYQFICDHAAERTELYVSVHVVPLSVPEHVAKMVDARVLNGGYVNYREDA